MAAESGADVHHDAPRWLLRLFDATAGDLAEWSEFDDAEECYTGILSLANVGWDTNSEEARMGLSRYKVAPGVAVSDMDRARDFYEEKLGLSVRIDSGDNVQYRCGEGTMFHVYLLPEHAGNSTATLAGVSMTSRESSTNSPQRGSSSSDTTKGRLSRTRRASPRSRE